MLSDVIGTAVILVLLACPVLVVVGQAAWGVRIGQAQPGARASGPRGS